jgi:hypothetical protein
MRAGGIFGGNASLAGFGLGLTAADTARNIYEQTDWSGGWGSASSSAREAVCTAAFYLGVTDKKTGRALEKYNVVERIPGGAFLPGNVDREYLGNCYMMGYTSKEEVAFPGTTSGGGGKTSTTTGASVTSTTKSWLDDIASVIVGDSGGGGGGTSVTASGACCSKEVIQAVQRAIGTDDDGKWGPQSQAALQRSGKSFKAFAPDCTGPVPPCGGTSGGAPYVPPATPPPAAQPQSGLSLASLTGSPITWIALLALGVGGFLMLQKPKKGNK